MQNVLIHFAAPWEMVDEKSGKVNKGFSLQFLAPYTETRDGALGVRGTKTSIRDEAVFQKIAKLPLPVMGTLVLEAKPGTDGKLTAVVTDITDVRPVDLFGAMARAAGDKKAA